MENNIRDLRISYSKKEILSLLRSVFEGHLEFLVWQNDTGKRQKVVCLIYGIDMNSETITISPKDPKEQFHFSKELVLYFKGDEQDMLFKQHAECFSKTAIVLRIPRQIRILEKRHNSRKNYDFHEGKRIVLSKAVDENSAHRRFELLLLDCTSEGAALFITPHQLISFNGGEITYVTEIEGVKLLRPIKAIIRHVTRYYNSNFGKTIKGHRVGIQFVSEIPQNFKIPA